MRPYQKRATADDSLAGQQRRMVDYLKENFADVLGSDVDLLDEPDGLQILYTKYFKSAHASKRRAA